MAECQQGEPDLLASCYRHRLELAAAKQLRSIALPSISTRIYGYPIELVAHVAVNTVRAFDSQSGSIEEVIFCCFSDAYLAVYEAVLHA